MEFTTLHNSLRFGDVVTLYNESRQGWLTSGDQVVGWGLWLPRLREKLAVPPRVRETRFQIVPKLYYSAHKASKKERHGAAAVSAATQDGLKASLEVERHQNQSEMKRLRGEDVIYGQIVQLRCCSSMSFVTVRKSMAKIESNCLKVEMDEYGDEGSWFRIEPTFKFRNIGNRISHGDSVRLVSVKFAQYLHVSTSCLPFYSPYIDGVYEINASANATGFQVIPFAADSGSSSENISCGRVICIKHSEINAYLMYNPNSANSKPYWSMSSYEPLGEWQASNALWSIESENVEWGGMEVCATHGVTEVDRSKKRGYRLEHVNSGLYLSLTSSAKSSISELSMTDTFVSDRTLWYFHCKNEGSSDLEGKSLLIGVGSVTPIYLQHASGTWLSQLISDDSVGGNTNGNSLNSTASTNRRSMPEMLGDTLAADTRAGGGIAGGGGREEASPAVCKRTLSFTDSLSVLAADPHSMTEISRLLKLLKPIEFFLIETAKHRATYDIVNAASDELTALLDELDAEAQARGPQEPGALQLISNLNPFQSLPRNGLQDIFSPDPSLAAGLPMCKRVDAAIAALRARATRDPSTGRPRLNRLFVVVARARLRVLILRKRRDGVNLRARHVELVRSLQSIKAWLCEGGPGEGEPDKWHQNTLREQGALTVLSRFLRVLVDAGLSFPRTSEIVGSIEEMGGYLASKSFADLGSALFDILRLASRDNAPNALALEGSLPVYDVYLGSAFNAAELLHEMLKNREVMRGFAEDRVAHYVGLMCHHQRPVFVQLIRSFLTCDGRPVPVNQRRVARLLLKEYRSALPEVKIVLGAGRGQHAKVSVRGVVYRTVRQPARASGPPQPAAAPAVGGDGGGSDAAAGGEAGRQRSPKPRMSSVDMEKPGPLAPAPQPVIWYDLGKSVSCFADICAKDPTQMNYEEVTIAYYGEMLLLFRDLCAGRCMEAIALLCEAEDLGMEYGSLLGAMQSELIPLEVRSRLCEMMMVLHIDKEPLQLRPAIQEVHFLNPDALHDSPSSEFTAQSAPPAFADLKAVTLSHIEGCITASATTTTLTAHVALLKSFCQIALQLCRFGIFTANMEKAAGLNDLIRLVVAALDNISKGRLLNEIDVMLQWTFEPAVTQALKCAAAEHEEVLQLFCSILEFAFDTRTNLRMKEVLRGYENAIKTHGVFSGVKFWDQKLLEYLLKAMDHSTLSERLTDSPEVELTECIFKLVRRDNLRLQASGYQLLMRQGTPMIEVLGIANRFVLLNDRHAIGCYYRQCESVKMVRESFHSIKYARHEALIAVADKLRVLIELLDPDVHGAHVVSECQKMMRLNLFHNLICEILALPLEVVRGPRRLNKAVNPLMHQVFQECYIFLQAFCFRNTENQTEVFAQLDLFMQHISIDGLDATDCIAACLRDNVVLCSKVTEKILRRFFMAVVEYGKRARWLRLMLVCMTADGQPIARCQDLVLRSLEGVAEVILELDGNQGAKLDRNAPGTGGSDDKVAGREPGGPGGGADDDADRRLGISKGEAAKVLAREGTATRFELMMQREHEKPDSFLEYHVACLEILTKCAEGRRLISKIKCQAFLTFEEVIDNILDLHLIDRPEGAPKVPADSLRYVRKGFVRFLHHAYVSFEDIKAQKLIARDSNRWYNYDKPAQIEKWRSPTSLMDHFIEEIHALRAAVVKDQTLGHTKRMSARNTSKFSTKMKTIDYQRAYIFDAVVPCLADYYLNPYLSSMNEETDYAKRRKLYAFRVCSSVKELIEVADLDHDEAKLCAILLENLSHIVGTSSKYPSTNTAAQEAEALEVSAEATQKIITSSWMIFIQDLVARSGMGDEVHGVEEGIGKVAKMLFDRNDDRDLPSLVAVLRTSMTDQQLIDEKFSILFLKVLQNIVHLSRAEQHRFLNAKVLQTALLLVSHPNDEIVAVAILLAGQILSTSRQDAQADAAQSLAGPEGRAVLESCRKYVKAFFEQIRAGNKQRKKIQAAAAVSTEEQASLDSCAAINNSASRACELLEMLELLCKGNPVIQSKLREYEVISAIVDFMEEAERNIMSEIAKKNVFYVFALAKGFHVLLAALEGPNAENRVALTHTTALSMLDRIFAKLSYSGPEPVHNLLKSTVRRSSIHVMCAMLEAPADPQVAKRLLETIDWGLYFKSWNEAREHFEVSMDNLGIDCSEFLISARFRQSESISQFQGQVSAVLREGRRHSSGSFGDREGSSRSGCEGEYSSLEPAVAQSAADIFHEAFIMAEILELALDENLFRADMILGLARQKDLKNLTAQELTDGMFALYHDRLASIEISRDGVLQRFLFKLPEACMRLKHDVQLMDRVRNFLFHDVEKSSEGGDDDRRNVLLSRMAKCSDILRCEFELSRGSHKWIVVHKSRLQKWPFWASIALNVVFIFGFEEHGSGARICSTSRIIDSGYWGKPHFHFVPWLMMTFAVFHFALCAVQLTASLLQRGLHYSIEAKRVLTSASADGAAGTGPPAQEYLPIWLRGVMWAIRLSAAATSKLSDLALQNLRKVQERCADPVDMSTPRSDARTPTGREGIINGARRPSSENNEAGNAPRRRRADRWVWLAGQLARIAADAVEAARLTAAEATQELHRMSKGASLNAETVRLRIIHGVCTDWEVWCSILMLGASLAGFYVSPFFYAAPLIDLLQSPTVHLLLQSVEGNAGKLGQGGLVLLLVAYLHAIVGYVFFSELHEDGKCNSLFDCSLTYIVSGIKGESIQSIMQEFDAPPAVWVGAGEWARILLDLSFHVVIPVILLSIISGIIIDGFGELRDRYSEAKEHRSRYFSCIYVQKVLNAECRENTCLICGLDRTTMDARAGIGAFDHHLTSEHNPDHYVFLLYQLQTQSPDQDSSAEAYIRRHLTHLSAAFFPHSAIRLQARTDPTAGQESKIMIEYLKNIELRLTSVEREMRWNSKSAPPIPTEEVIAAEEQMDLWQNLNSFNPLNGVRFPDVRLPEMNLPTLDIRAPEVPECKQQ